MQPASPFFFCSLSVRSLLVYTFQRGEVCILGFVMTLFVPAIAWIEEAALIVLLGVIVLIGVGTTFWWIGSEEGDGDTFSAARDQLISGRSKHLCDEEHVVRNIRCPLMTASLRR